MTLAKFLFRSAGKDLVKFAEIAARREVRDHKVTMYTFADDSFLSIPHNKSEPTIFGASK